MFAGLKAEKGVGGFGDMDHTAAPGRAGVGGG